MIELNKIYNMDCMDCMNKIDDGTVDFICTSPPYNTNAKAGKGRTLQNTSVKSGQYAYVRYDGYVDTKTNEEYFAWTVGIFKEFHRILKDSGVVLYNLSYGSENTSCMINAVSEIIKETEFELADIIVWKKPNALPNTCSSNKATRVCEFIYVFCKKGELKTFYTNKKIVSQRESGQNMYDTFDNIICAKNNDESCPYNKATYSTELCYKLFQIYAKENAVVYDPFIGSGTTAVAAKKFGLKYIGSELSENQVKWANSRLSENDGQLSIFNQER